MRRSVPVRVQVGVAIAQPRHIDGGLKCPRCSGALQPNDERILEHMTPHATCVWLGTDPDRPENLRFVHKECADKKTNGNKATVADGDIHKIAKAKRLAAARTEHEAVLSRVMKREPSRIRSRGFGPNTKKFSGAVSPSKQRKPDHASTD